MKKIKTVQHQPGLVHDVRHGCFHGELLLTPLDELPKGLRQMQRENGALIVGHSETGHHHAIRQDDVVGWEDPNDEYTVYLQLAPTTEGAVLEHYRDQHTHATSRLLNRRSELGEVLGRNPDAQLAAGQASSDSGGRYWRVRRQREQDLTNQWRRAID